MTKDNNNILYLDDEVTNLNIFKLNIKKEFTVFTSDNYAEAFDKLAKEKIKVFITDQRMPDKSGIEIISKVNQLYPNIVCILISGYTDKTVLLKSINEVKLFRVIEKPWNAKEVIHTLNQAIEVFDTTAEKVRIAYELKKAVKQAKLSERLKSEFLSNISHEIRTPLNGIVGFIALIEEKLKSDDVLKQYINIINDSAHKLTKIIDDTIFASRLQSGDIESRKESTYLNDVLDEVFDTFQLDANQNKAVTLKVKHRTQPTRLRIETDKEKLLYVFSHLLRNAFKFTKEGEIEFGIHNEEQQILFVKDSGIGIEAEDMKTIFDFFTQGKQDYLSREYGGIGLGLYNVKGMLDIVGGKIWLESEKNQGTTFYFKFPFIPVEENIPSQN